MIITAKELAESAINVAKNYKTIYVSGCFGAPMTEENKLRYLQSEVNQRDYIKPKINSASPDTFGFDCVCFIKGLLWGWNGDASKTYGGAVYQSNGVPDIGEGEMFKRCLEQSTDFSNIEIGEAVWMEGHIGIYVGNGLSVECTHRWDNGVQFTGCNQNVPGYNYRQWTAHGKLPYVTYQVNYSTKDFVMDIQKALGLNPTGIADKILIDKTITVSQYVNNTHDVVKFIQKKLYSLGYPQVGAADGEAGAKFTTAVIAYQHDFGGTEDGEITAKSATWKKLLEYVEEPEYTFNVGDEVLIKEGSKYYNGTIPAKEVYNKILYVRQINSNGTIVVSDVKIEPLKEMVYSKDIIPYNGNNTYEVQITANLLNVRSGASTSNPIVKQLKKNTKCTILEEKDGWGRINYGWIYLIYTKRV